MITLRPAFIVTASMAMQLASLNCPALAADLGSFKDTAPMVEAVPIWEGFYFGGHAGGVWSAPKAVDTFTYIGDPTIDSKFSSKDFIGGVQAGYNFQRGHFVFGPEADIGYLGISANKSFFQPGTDATCVITYPDHSYVAYGGWACDVAGKYSVSSDLYGDLTARLGYEMDRTLFYVKGGGALLHADFKANYVGNNCTVLGPYCAGAGFLDTVREYSIFNYNHSEILLGWTVGAGAEYALSPAWSVKAEYQHFDFGKMSYTYYGCHGFPLASGSYPDPTYGKCPAGTPAWDNHYTSTLRGKTEVEITADAVKVGINYHLNNEGAQK
jgi:outer membrane immunogenic protein